MKKIIAILFLLFFAWFWLYTKWAFWEPKEFEKGSWAYISKVPKDIKEFEAIKPDSAATYSYYMAEGVKPEVIVQEYTSKESVAKLKNYFNSLNLDCYFKGNSNTCLGYYKEMRVYVILKPIKNTKKKVQVEFSIYY